MNSEHVIAAVDLGKTRCRVAVDGAPVRSGDGAPGLAASGGVDRAAKAILRLLVDEQSPTHIGIGAAGAWAAPDAAQTLAERLAETTGAAVAVTSDVVTAHAGALRGRPGVLLIAGTGAAALGADSDGIRLIDGWGPDVGDFGSGSWLGREAVRAVLRARVGVGPSTVLTDAVAESIAPSTDLISWVAQQEALARALGTLAPLVLDAAEHSDAVGLGIAAEAVRLLTASALAASDTAEIALHGGLTGHTWFRARIGDALSAAGRTVVPVAGDALDGAALLANRSDLPHERFMHRAE